MFQVIVWPLFYIFGLSDSQKNTLKSWFLKLTRAACRLPKFVDFESIQTLIGVENFDTLTTRQVATKVFCIDARTHWYRQNGVNCSEDTSDIFTPLIQDIERQESYNLRHERDAYPFKFSQKIIQNHVYEAVNNALKIEDAPWRKSSTYFVNVAFEMVKFMARQYVEPLVENRKNIIKKSVYAHELKHIKSRDQQNIIISQYIESTRNSDG